MLNKQIIAFHLLNDFSGSPVVLKNILTGLAKQGYSIHLITSSGGILEDLIEENNIKITHINYKFYNNKIRLIFQFIIAQILFFIYGLKFGHKSNIFLINTILPFGGALAGKFKNAETIYYYHENAKAKGFLYRTLAYIMQRIADKIICVSKYQSQQLKRQNNVYIIPNTISEKYSKISHLTDPHILFKNKIILFIGSLKKYKGIIEFFKLAENLPKYKFCAVISDSEENIESFIINENLKRLSNLKLFPRQKDLSPFYLNGSILLNLSKKSQVIETFGMTALEALTFGIPVIVPTIGGIADLVEDGVTGFKIDAENINQIVNTIERILSDYNLYQNLSKNAKSFSEQFDQSKTISSLISILK